jgi:hypothetical protein
VVDLAALEMLCTGNRTVGSNPTLSARKAAGRRHSAFSFFCVKLTAESRLADSFGF